ncbi:MAG: redox-regulated ATPase YchF [Candidatus Diapherotrites archaeon]|nr:redox-regulated ATPase YchF [Candidatus Diapherotrites archaeon]
MIIGLVGKPSSGKSTFFNACTLLNVPTAAHPFTTIEPNKGVGFVRIECVDKEFGIQCTPRTGYCLKGQRFVPVELIDVAGLVPGASEGKGMGNQFLSDLSRADVLIHVVDASGSANEKGEILKEGSFNPCNDVKFLEKEINEWFKGIIHKNWNKFNKTHVESKAKLIELLAQNLSGIGASEKKVEKTLRELSFSEKKLSQWTEEEIKLFSEKLRHNSLEIIIAANKCDKDFAEENIEKMKKEFPNTLIVPCSAIAEFTLKKAAKEKAIDYLPGDSDYKELMELNESQKKGLDYIKENVLKKFGSTGVQEILNKASFEFLDYIAIFPGGTKGFTDSQGRIMPDCFLMPNGSTALDFAFKLHTDIGKGFIKAIDVKTKQTIGKEHKLKHRDIIEIVFKK